MPTSRAPWAALALALAATYCTPSTERTDGTSAAVDAAVRVDGDYDAAVRVDGDYADVVSPTDVGVDEDATSGPLEPDAGSIAELDARSVPTLDGSQDPGDAGPSGDSAADAGVSCRTRDTDAPPRAASFPARLAGQDAWIHDERSAAGYFHTYDALTLGPDTRKIHVFLPRSYPAGCQRYPVLYMHDGDAVFFPGPVGKTWDVQRLLEQAYAAQQIREVIVVAVHPLEREREYTHVPWLPGHACCGLPTYTDYLADVLKAFVDGAYRTDSGPQQTIIAGSSHGGLAAFYAATVRGDVFGRAIAMSSSLWVGLDSITVGGPLSTSALMQASAPGLAARPRLYLDWGLIRTGGTHNSLIEARATARGREMAGLLQQSYGYVPGVDLLTVEDPQGEHDEDSWRRRLGPALQFILRP